jgi:hypothetical protein
VHVGWLEPDRLTADGDELINGQTLLLTRDRDANSRGRQRSLRSPHQDPPPVFALRRCRSWRRPPLCRFRTGRLCSLTALVSRGRRPIDVRRDRQYPTDDDRRRTRNCRPTSHALPRRAHIWVEHAMSSLAGAARELRFKQRARNTPGGSSDRVYIHFRINCQQQINDVDSDQPMLTAFPAF